MYTYICMYTCIIVYTVCIHTYVCIMYTHICIHTHSVYIYTYIYIHCTYVYICPYMYTLTHTRASFSMMYIYTSMYNVIGVVLVGDKENNRVQAFQIGPTLRWLGTTCRRGPSFLYPPPPPLCPFPLPPHKNTSLIKKFTIQICHHNPWFSPSIHAISVDVCGCMDDE